MDLFLYGIAGQNHPLHFSLGISTERMIELDAINDNLLLAILTPTPKAIKRNTAEFLKMLANASENLQEYAYLSAIFIHSMSQYGRLSSLEK